MCEKEGGLPFYSSMVGSYRGDLFPTGNEECGLLPPIDVVPLMSSIRLCVVILLVWRTTPFVCYICPYSEYDVDVLVVVCGGSHMIFPQCGRAWRSLACRHEPCVIL